MKKIDYTINELKGYVKELDKYLDTKIDAFDDETKKKAQDIVDKTVNVLNKAVDKVKKAIEDIKDDERLDDFLDKLTAKAKEAVDIAKTKIEDLSDSSASKSLDKLHADIMDDFDSLKESEIYKKTTVFIKDLGTKVNDFFGKPEVKDTIKKVKATTVTFAKKGVDELQKALNKDNKKTEKKPVKKTVKKAVTKKPTKKVTTKKPTTKKTTKKTKTDK